jgi:signal transduction histidine kinase
MFKSIFRRLFWTYTLIIIIIFIIISATVSFVLNSYIQMNQVGDILSVSKSLEKMTGAYQIESTDIRARNAYKQNLINWANFLHGDIIVVNNDGEIAESTGFVTKVPDEYLKNVISGNIIKEKGYFGGEYDEPVLTIGVPIKYNGNIIAAMFFNSYIPKMRQNLFEILSMFLVSGLLSIAIAFILVYIQSKHISKPIVQINSAARDIAAGNLSHRVTVNSADEIGQLASSFNFMADSIEDLEKQRSGFVSDVSHELRTPMTSITGFIQGILDGTIPEEKREYYLNIVLEESKRLTKLVNDLLEMSKMSSSEYHLNITSFDLNELIRICIIGAENQLESKNLDLNVDFASDSLKVIADKDAITRVIINILDNAVKFSYPNTTIGIKTWVESHKAYVCIGNFGDGIDGADLSNIFKRFYKTDKSRTKDKSGAGLGLSFVKNILTLHKQSIWVESVDTKEGSNAKYTKFTFTLETE